MKAGTDYPIQAGPETLTAKELRKLIQKWSAKNIGRGDNEGEFLEVVVASEEYGSGFYMKIQETSRDEWIFYARNETHLRQMLETPLRDWPEKASIP